MGAATLGVRWAMACSSRLPPLTPRRRLAQQAHELTVRQRRQQCAHPAGRRCLGSRKARSEDRDDWQGGPREPLAAAKNTGSRVGPLAEHRRRRRAQQDVAARVRPRTAAAIFASRRNRSARAAPRARRSRARRAVRSLPRSSGGVAAEKTRLGDPVLIEPAHAPQAKALPARLDARAHDRRRGAEPMRGRAVLGDAAGAVEDDDVRALVGR